MNRTALKQFAKFEWKTIRWKVFFAMAMALGLLIVPGGVKGQFGLDPCCAIISAGLNSISGLLKNVVAKPLSQIQQIQQQAANFEQEVIYPATAITNARGLSGQIRGQLEQMTQVFRRSTASATLPAPQQLEQVLLSHNPQSMGQVSQSYAKVYGTGIAPADAPPAIRDLADMTDAEAQAALKKALQLDALAEVELAVADQINQQIQNAAPGSAPILEAQASAWLVRANAYTQSAMAELIRVRAVDLASSGAQLKFRANDTNQLRNNTNQLFEKGSQ
jgi:hypothetical protein